MKSKQTPINKKKNTRTSRTHNKKIPPFQSKLLLSIEIKPTKEFHRKGFLINNIYTNKKKKGCK